MLPAISRLTRRQDFAETLRRGPSRRRVAMPTIVVHVRLAEPAGRGEEAGDGARVGFVVSRAVGPAVTRNLVKRRLRAAVQELWSLVPTGSRVVVRALPPAATASYAQLRAACDSALTSARIRSANVR